MKNDSMSRRDALRNTALFAAGAAGLALVGCSKKELACTDTTGLAAQDKEMRTMLAYVDHTADPAKPCVACQLYKPAAPDTCGGCTVLKGPIHPDGYCQSWTKKQS